MMVSRYRRCWIVALSAFGFAVGSGAFAQTAPQDLATTPPAPEIAPSATETAPPVAEPPPDTAAVEAVSPAHQPATPSTTGTESTTESAGPVRAGIPEERAKALTAALDALAAGDDIEASEGVKSAVLDTSFDDDDWHEFYRGFFAEIRTFTPGHATFWGAAVANGGADAAKFAQASCRFAIEGLAACLRREPADLTAAGTALQWLDQAALWLGPERIAPVEEAIRAAFEEPLDLRPLIAPDGAYGLNGLQLGIQTALSLGNLVEPALFNKLVTLPESTRALFAQRGVFVFDNGLLNPMQLQSLDSLLAAFPAPLHQVIALVVPEGIRTGAAQLNLVSPRQVIDIAAIPMDVLSDPSEFIPRAGQPIAPEFTLAAAVQLLRAAQRVQFSLRPDLAVRRDAILGRADLRRERYVRRSIPPDVYLSDPDELLPQTGYLWMIDSSLAFYQAMELLKLRENEALDAVLLLADMLSGGGGSTLLFSTDPLGHVVSEETALRRVAATPDLAFTTGIGVAGRLWTFDLNEQGGVMRYYRDGSPVELW